MEKYDDKTFLEMCKTASFESEKLERLGLSFYETPEAKKILEVILKVHKENKPSTEKPKETFYQKARKAAFRLQGLGELYYQTTDAKNIQKIILETDEIKSTP